MWTSRKSRRYDRSRLRYPSDLTDEEWALVEPLIAPAKRGGNRRHVVVREVVNGLMYILSTGCQWRAIAKDLPPHSTLYDYFDLLGWTARLIASTTRFMRSAAKPPRARRARRRDHRQPERQERGKRGLRLIRRATMQAKRSRAGSAHPLDTQGLLMHAIVHAADVQDRDGGAPLMASLFGTVPFLIKLYADGGYQGPESERGETDSGARQRRNRQAIGSNHRLRRTAQALDRRTHLRGRPLPTTGQRLGMSNPRPGLLRLASIRSCCENSAVPHDVLGQTLSTMKQLATNPTKCILCGSNLNISKPYFRDWRRKCYPRFCLSIAHVGSPAYSMANATLLEKANSIIINKKTFSAKNYFGANLLHRVGLAPVR